MRFLIDAQLSPALKRFLAAQGHEAHHVGDFGMLSAKDGEIRRKAMDLDAVIVTKDRDFFERFDLNNGPQLLWLHFPNLGNALLLQRLEPLMPSIVAALESGERLVEVAQSGTRR